MRQKSPTFFRCIERTSRPRRRSLRSARNSACQGSGSAEVLIIVGLVCVVWAAVAGIGGWIHHVKQARVDRDYLAHLQKLTKPEVIRRGVSGYVVECYGFLWNSCTVLPPKSID